ncbi:hypothetical protein [Nocardioides fonticola]|uniref:hypothetical protein n=1 Tax=Nocardioides fonticola TaxID=450363 RepID=UPI0031E35614
MERKIDFSRERQMLCEECEHRWMVDLDWIDRWNHGGETCPGCGTNCERERSARVTVDLTDAALTDEAVGSLHWYHTSTQQDWPTKAYDTVSELTAAVRRLMGGDERVAEWADRQRKRALHVGTYEAAIQNMLRRITDQDDRGRQFFLYRVHLTPTVVVRTDWLIDPSDFVGDVMLEDVCPSGVDVARYLNYHEDPGGLSLALGRDAIASVQQVAVPLTGTRHNDWVGRAAETLFAASDAVVATNGYLARVVRLPSPRANAGRELARELTERLPVNLRDQFASAASFDEGDDPEQWAMRVAGLFDLIDDPGRVIATLDRRPHRTI